MKKIALLFVGIIVAVAMLFAFGWTAPAPAPAVKYGGIKDIRILDGASTAAVFVNYSARAKVTNDIPGLRASCIAGAMEPNMDALERGTAEFSHGATEIQVDLVAGTGRFKGKNFKNIAFLATGDGFRAPILAVRADSNVNTVQDLKSKHIATSTKGSGTAALWERMMGLHGITPSNIGQWGGRFSFISPGDATTGMRDRTIDAIMTTTGFYEPTEVLVELLNTVGVKLIPLDPKAIDEYVKVYPPAIKATVPAELYKTKENYKTFAAGVTNTVCRLDLPEDLVYDVLRAWFSKQGRKTYYDAFPAGMCFVLENGLQGVLEGIPVHPGAMKFYKEHGVTAAREFIWPKSKEDALNNYGGKWDWPWK